MPYAVENSTTVVEHDPTWTGSTHHEPVAVIETITTVQRAAGIASSPSAELSDNARDAWDQVQNAMADGTPAKASAH